jgi:hypothetical protein
MWIKYPNKKLVGSNSQFVNFLFQKDNIYIMDNHLAASWCWINQLDLNQSYNLFHIDRHYDLLCDDDVIQSTIIDAQLDLKKFSFSEYCNLLNPAHDDFKLFRWDNYILNLNKVYPNLIIEKYFATHKDGFIPKNFVVNEKNIFDLYTNIEYWLESKKNRKWIMNLDLDYFFNDLGEDKIQIVSDEYIKEVAKEIKKSLKYIDVLTICLSPECCGGWGNAIRVNKIICEVLEIDFSLDNYEY